MANFAFGSVPKEVKVKNEPAMKMLAAVSMLLSLEMTGSL